VGVLQYKDKFPDGTAVLDIERGKLDDLREEYWQTDTSVSYRSWSYIEDDHFRNTPSLGHDLVDIVSKNGNLLLNVGPRADGVIPDEPANLLRGLGAWLSLNGEAIYETRHWKVYGEGPTNAPTVAFKEHENAPFTPQDVRFTTSKDGKTLYAICLGWPGASATIGALGELAPRIRQVTMLGVAGALEWEAGEAGVTIACPPRAPCEHAVTFKVELD
jgi:alpha-L-fucosidase